MMVCSGCKWSAELRFRNYLEQMDIDLDGSILDVACGPYSLGCIYDNVHGHDNSPKSIRSLKEMGIPACLADISELDYPPKSFHYVVTFNPPLRPFRERGNARSGIRRFLEDMLRIAQERVIIRSRTIIPLLPEEYDSLIDKKGDNFAIYRADRYIPGPEAGTAMNGTFASYAISLIDSFRFAGYIHRVIRFLSLS